MKKTTENYGARDEVLHIRGAMPRNREGRKNQIRDRLRRGFSAIFLNNRVANVCDRLKLKPLAFLWERYQSELLNEIVESGIDAILITVAALSLVPEKHLGKRKTLKEMQPFLTSMKHKFGRNVCREGGEYTVQETDFSVRVEDGYCFGGMFVQLVT